MVVAGTVIRNLLERVSDCLSPGSRLIVKDIDTNPAYKRWFTYVLDKMMDYKTPVHYWPRQELSSLLENLGFEVFQHTITDYLPYPHLMYICRDQRSAMAAAPAAAYQVAKGHA